ncbi:MAG: NAD-dependent epimerase/dehydratase family protein [Candidatus Omnitrophota bacterium]
MKVLVTGGAGFVGSNLSATLLGEGYDVVILDDLSCGREENIRLLKADFIKGSIEDTALIDSLAGKRFGVIFHEAAITDTTVVDEKKMTGVNVDGFRNILKLAQKEKSRVVYASSAGVYGNGPVPMKETQKLLPLNSYAVSKAKMDEIAPLFTRETGLPAVGLRYFNVYGPKETHKLKAASMIWQLAEKMKKGIAPRIFKHGEQDRDFIYVKDVIDATIKASQAKKGGVVNAGTGIATTFNRIIEILNSVLKTNFKPEYFDNPYGFYQDHTLAEVTNARELVGFTAKYSIKDGIEDYFKDETLA